LDQRFCRIHLDGGNVPDLQNENPPDPGGELQITDHVSILRRHHGALQSQLSVLWQAIAIGMNGANNSGSFSSTSGSYPAGMPCV
jgi:hypothetical protein